MSGWVCYIECFECVLVAPEELPRSKNTDWRYTGLLPRNALRDGAMEFPIKQKHGYTMKCPDSQFRGIVRSSSQLGEMRPFVF